MTMKRRIGILTSGGDCPGLNACIRGVARASYSMFDAEIVGIQDGYAGLIAGDYKEMKQSDFSGILTLGGTILGTSRQPFKEMRKTIEDSEETKLDKMLHTVKKAGFDCLVILGGIGRIGRVSEKLVPVMALLYLGGGLAVILGNLRRLPEAVTLMLRCAVAPEAALGGALGIVTRREALRWGVARSVFSNEAGLGSAAITAACADTEDPVKQGLISMTGVFFDTMVICAVTGLAICCSGTLGAADGNGRPLTGAALTLRAFETVLGPLAPWLIGVALGLFAFTSVLGCAVQAETTASYLLGPEAVRPCRVLYGLAVFAGAVIPMATVLQLADLANALMAFPNLVCLLLLSDEIAGECRRKDR